jgi:RNA polymerase sigma-70 factor (ECF subfamily)
MPQVAIARLEDADLVLRVVAGDVEAFEAIYDRYNAQVLRFAVRLTGTQRAAEEVTQDVFLSFWRSAGRYDTSRGALKTWLLAIVRNRSVDWLRREARHGGGLQIDDAEVQRLEAAERTDQQVADREQSAQVRQLLKGLPTEQREVIELSYFRELTHTEIASEVNIPLGTVKGRQRLGLGRLHRTLTSSPGSQPSTAWSTAAERIGTPAAA